MSALERTGRAAAFLQAAGESASGWRVARTEQRYGSAEIALHWATALLVVVQYSLAQLWSLVPHATGAEMKTVHISLGVLLAAVIALRILWRAGAGSRLAPVATGLAELAAKLMHYMLYALLVAVVALGFCERWSAHGSIDVFGLFAVPSPLPIDHARTHLFLSLHSLAANAIAILAGLHAAAALFHHFVLKDGVLRRMLPMRFHAKAGAPASGAGD